MLCKATKYMWSYTILRVQEAFDPQRDCVGTGYHTCEQTRRACGGGSRQPLNMLDPQFTDQVSGIDSMTKRRFHANVFAQMCRQICSTQLRGVLVRGPHGSALPTLAEKAIGAAVRLYHCQRAGDDNNATRTPPAGTDLILNMIVLFSCNALSIK